MENLRDEALQQNTSSDKPAEFAGVRKLVIGSVLATGIPTLTGTAYLVGVAFHTAYLRTFHLPLLLEKTTADYFLYAWEACTTSLMRLIGSAGVFLLSLIFLWVVFWRLCNKVGQKIENGAWSKRQRERFRTAPGMRVFAETVLLPLLCCVLVGYVVLGLVVALILPAYLGENAGRRRAEEEIAIFKKGCAQNIAASHFCNEIREGDKLVSRGFIIDGSEKYVAVYENGVAKLIPAEDKHFVAVY